MKKSIVLLVFFTLIFFLYRISSTGMPTGYADSDELIITSYFHSVSHPPGFPLFTSLGHLFFILFSPLANPAVISQIITALYHTLTLFLIFLSTKRLTTFFMPHRSTNTHIILALIGTASLAFSYDFWLYATIYEVTALTALLGALTLTSALYWLTQSNPHSWSFYATWASAGLLLSHYHLAIILFPGLLLALINKYKQEHISFSQTVRPIFLGVAVLIIVFLVSNSLLFIQNQPHPISWNFDNTISGWWHHIVRRDYTGIDLETNTEFESAFPLLVPIDSYSLKSITDYLIHLTQSFTLLPIILALIGSIIIIKHNKQQLGFILIMFLFSGPILAAYMRTSSIQFQPQLYTGIAFRQFFLSYLFIPLLIPLGINAVSQITKQKQTVQQYLIPLIATTILVSQLSSNSSLVRNKSDRLQASTLAMSRLNQAADNAVIICTTDLDCYTLFYYHYILASRPDLTVISHVPAYNNHYLSTRPEIIPFLVPQNPEYLTLLLTGNLNKRPIYVTGGINFYSEFFGWENGPLYMHPDGVLIQLSTTLPKPFNVPQQKIVLDPFDNRNAYALGIREIIGNLYGYQGYLSMKYNFTDQARQFLDRALTYSPEDPQTQELITYFDQISNQINIEQVSYSLTDIITLAQSEEANGNLEEADKWYRIATILYSTDQTAVTANREFYERHNIPDRFNMLAKLQKEITNNKTGQ